MARKMMEHSAFTQKYWETPPVTTLNYAQMRSAIVKMEKNAFVMMEPA